MGHEGWKEIGSIEVKEGIIETIKVRSSECPIPDMAQIIPFEVDELDNPICRRVKILGKGKQQIMHICPFLRGMEGPFPMVICSFPENEDISSIVTPVKGSF